MTSKAFETALQAVENTTGGTGSMERRVNEAAKAFIERPDIAQMDELHDAVVQLRAALRANKIVWGNA